MFGRILRLIRGDRDDPRLRLKQTAPHCYDGFVAVDPPVSIMATPIGSALAGHRRTAAYDLVVEVEGSRASAVVRKVGSGLAWEILIDDESIPNVQLPVKQIRPGAEVSEGDERISYRHPQTRFEACALAAAHMAHYLSGGGRS